MRLFFSVTLTVILLSAVGETAPEPSVVTKPGQWTVDVEFTHPRQIVSKVLVDGKLKPKSFWYVILTVTNDTGRDVGFYPQCELMTDTFEITPAGQTVPGWVFEQIRNRHRVRYPFLESLEQTSNKLLQGEDHSRDIAIIWPYFDDKANAVKIFISGLSNETAALKHPTAKTEQAEPVMLYLCKTLELDYDVKGQATAAGEIKLQYRRKQWVMR